jgi:hypothetical protein
MFNEMVEVDYLDVDPVLPSERMVVDVLPKVALLSCVLTKIQCTVYRVYPTEAYMLQCTMKYPNTYQAKPPNAEKQKMENLRANPPNSPKI